MLRLRSIVADALLREADRLILSRRYPAPIAGADWTMSATEVAAVALSLALSKHVPGWPGAEDEQLEAVARAVIAELERPHTIATFEDKD